MLNLENEFDEHSQWLQDSAILAAILDTAVDAIVTINSQGLVLHVNRAFQKMFGFLPAEVIGQNVSMLMPEPDRSAHDGYLHRYHATRQASIIGIGRQVMGKRKNGSMIPVDLAVSEVRIGSQVLYTGILRDMTERRQVEDDLRQAQMQLIQSERLAAIGQMMTGIAHESRNALQRSRACLDMLDLDLESAPEQQDLVRRSRAALVELQTLHEEVRNYAAPIQLDRSYQSIYKLCLEAWNHLEPIWRESNVKIAMHFESVSEVFCDPTRLVQVFRNIFENSLAAAPNGSQIVVATRHVQRPSGLHVQVNVTDQGPGLNEEQCTHIFDPFYTTKTKGTGLGMAICQRIINAHHGTIAVGNSDRSDLVPAGATISIELPSKTA